jgi:hypothetical protein
VVNRSLIHLIGLGDLIQIKSSKNLHFILENIDLEKHNDKDNSLREYIKIAEVSNPSGHGILKHIENYAPETGLQTTEIGSYKKLYTMKCIKLYVLLSGISLFSIHFLNYKESISVSHTDLQKALA